MSHLRGILSLSLLIVCWSNSPTRGQEIDADRSELTLSRIFDSREFQASDVAARWLDTGSAYEVAESARDGGTEIVQYDVATGARTIIVPAQQFVPPGREAPLVVDDYAWSRDRAAVVDLHELSTRVAQRRVATIGCSTGPVANCGNWVAKRGPRL